MDKKSKNLYNRNGNGVMLVNRIPDPIHPVCFL